MANYHVVENSEGGWDALREGAGRAGAHADTQQEAESEAKELAAGSGGGEVRIHDRDGRIRDSDTVPPARDPFPPRDTRH